MPALEAPPLLPDDRDVVSLDRVVPYLMDRGHLTAEALLSCGVVVSSAGRRNNAYRVDLGPQGRGFFVKRYVSADGHHRELAACRALSAGGISVIPAVVDADGGQRTTTFDLIRDAVPAWTLLSAATSDVITLTWGRIGDALRETHQVGSAAQADLPRHIPWALGIIRPSVHILRTLSRANAELLGILQEEFPEELFDFESAVDTQPVLVHGDMKLDNVLVRQSSGAVYLVDWELAHIGDPAWDVAGLIQDIIAMTVRNSLTLSLSGGDSLLRSSNLATSAFYAGYCGEQVDASFALRVARYVGVRLLQTAYEFAPRASQLTEVAVLLMQASHNILTSPQTAMSWLFEESARV